ncbi:MAG: cellulase family glycosylhydrolase [Candidatus Omnitrophica bacterium]|nr:cellulase family glycosylhydrolase [Candidatus Omnitrophota bacterium]
MSLRGVNLGSWLLMEGYILGGRNIPEHVFKKRFVRTYGKKELSKFENEFRNSFIAEGDLKRISSWKASCVRVPFNYRLIEKSPYKYSEKGLMILKRLVSWAKKYKLYIILDLHAGPGSQNADWHADSSGKALLWKKPSFQERTFALWQYLANEFKDEASVYGYDVLNEPVLEKDKISLLKSFYGKLINKIREVDKNHTIFLEGNLWAQEIDFLKDLLNEKIAVSIHTYQPLDFTFNFRPGYRYPGYINKVFWDKSVLKKSLERYKIFSQRNSVDVFVGEFGINYRAGLFGELNWLKDLLDIFKKWGFSWTYWTYKAVANHVFPDGIMQYLENEPWVKREANVRGWENFLNLWQKSSLKVISSLKSRSFTENRDVLNILKKYF